MIRKFLGFLYLKAAGQIVCIIVNKSAKNIERVNSQFYMTTIRLKDQKIGTKSRVRIAKDKFIINLKTIY